MDREILDRRAAFLEWLQSSEPTRWAFRDRKGDHIDPLCKLALLAGLNREDVKKKTKVYLTEMQCLQIGEAFGCQPLWKWQEAIAGASDAGEKGEVEEAVQAWWTGVVGKAHSGLVMAFPPSA